MFLTGWARARMRDVDKARTLLFAIEDRRLARTSGRWLVLAEAPPTACLANANRSILPPAFLDNAILSASRSAKVFAAKESEKRRWCKKSKNQERFWLTAIVGLFDPIRARR